MATVDLVCTFDAVNSDAWSLGSNVTVLDGSNASINRNPYTLTNLAFTTDAAIVIPSGSVVTSVKLLIKVAGQFSGGIAYLKNPGGFADGGATAHSITFTTTPTLYESIELSTERPGILTDPLTSGLIRMYHEYGYAANMFVDYVSLRVVYTVGSASVPVMFMGEVC